MSVFSSVTAALSLIYVVFTKSEALNAYNVGYGKYEVVDIKSFNLSGRSYVFLKNTETGVVRRFLTSTDSRNYPQITFLKIRPPFTEILIIGDRFSVDRTDERQGRGLVFVKY